MLIKENDAVEDYHNDEVIIGNKTTGVVTNHKTMLWTLFSLAREPQGNSRTNDTIT